MVLQMLTSRNEHMSSSSNSRLLLSTLVFLFLFGQMAICLQWKSQSYYGNLVKQTAVGTTIFNPTSTTECYNTTGTVVISLINCPYNTTGFFTDSSNRIALTKNFDAVNYDTYLPDCMVSCNDSVGVAAYTYLTINILGANTLAPVWDTSFPTTIRLLTLEPLQFLVDTLATDDDVDKTTDGRVSYAVRNVDGASQSTVYFAYESGGNSSRLLMYNTPVWNPGSVHTVVITAKDNPRTGAAKTITNTLTIQVPFDVITPSGFSTPTTTTTTTSTTSTTAATTSADSTSASSETTLSSSSTTSNSSSCEGIDALACDNRWIWLVMGIGVLLLLLGVFLAIFFYVRDGNKKRVEPSRRTRRTPWPQEWSPTNKPHYGQTNPNFSNY